MAEPYEPPAITRSFSFAPAPDAPPPAQLERDHLEGFAHAFRILGSPEVLARGEIALQPIRVECIACREHFLVLHSPMTKLGRLLLAEHLAEHADDPTEKGTR